ncbi:PrsW family intramembrane metalloprotease [Actinophytocola sp.]|uniref:PrsW family intramembrane metalloprotease n=1 Tax=Actinophytocola sp. TaxID=1872138 RepID=UPI002D7ECA36|nr:PrsW family intramembrane metalloprotease [Actinophytocola sp.]HET9139400.1 PrsW family intramembrane metalloprotease [Actinophytocola sp.]
MLLPVAGLLVLAACGLALLALSTARVGLTAELVGVTAALLPVGPVVAAFLWVDRWEPEPARLLWLAFGWGACVATITALMINNTAEAVGDVLLGAGNGDKISAMVSAPLFEEAAKGTFVLVIMLRLHAEFDGVIDGIVYAGLVATGFAFTENIYYFGRAFAEHGFGDPSTSGVVTAFILRGVLSPFTHPLFTCMIGVGIGVAARTRDRKLRVLAPVAGYLAAVVLHALWNGAATVGGGTNFLNVYFLIMVPIFIAAVLFVSWHRKREQQIVEEALPGLVGQRAVAAAEAGGLATLPGRRAWRAKVRNRFGRPAAQAIGGYQAAVSELAFLRHAMRSGTAGPDAADQEAKLVAVLAARRIDAVRLAGLPVLDAGGRPLTGTGEAGHEPPRPS